MTRQEHLQWCKNRALKYTATGELQNAVASMGSDLKKHPETTNNADVLVSLALMQFLNNSATKDSIEYWINGFN